MKNNLTNFPKINCITLPDLNSRHKFILDQSQKYSVDVEFIHGFDGRNISLDKLTNVTGNFLNQMNTSEICVSISHLKAINKWFNETSEEYGFFCEDDLNFSLNEFWPFTWSEFISKLPENWGVVQLVMLRNFEVDNIDNYVKFHQYKWDSWSTCCYIMSRRYAKQLINYHIKDEIFDLNLPYFPNTIPYAENVLYNADNKETVYSLPLFIEHTYLPSTFYPAFIDNIHRDNHTSESETISKWWNVEGKNKNLNWFFN